MAVDYANKKPPKRRASPKKRSAAATKKNAGAVRNQPGRRPSVPRLLLTAVVVIAFVAVLVLLKKKSTGSPRPQKNTQGIEETLPAPPQERWSYIDELENKEVEVLVPERAVSRPRLIQCASFRAEADADAMRAKIAFMGLEAQVRATQGEKGMWYRVILGPFENQRVAQSTAHKLQRGGISNCQIWNWTNE